MQTYFDFYLSCISHCHADQGDAIFILVLDDIYKHLWDVLSSQTILYQVSWDGIIGFFKVGEYHR